MRRFSLFGFGCLVVASSALIAQTPVPRTIPLPEHPRPDFERAEWLNLNGHWRFAFDAPNEGERAGWTNRELPGTRQILVPFSWGSPLSGVPDSADIGWYARSITVPESWRGRRVFLVFGASDWRTTAWL
ncbi:MAG: sugar-binding domain-containing protein, partial [Gemmatimonadaceae bacterium]